MYNIIETHAHIYDEAFAHDRNEMLLRAKNMGVTEIWMPNCNSETIRGMMDLAIEYPNFCLPMMGLHPCSVAADFEAQLFQIHKWFSKRKFAER